MAGGEATMNVILNLFQDPVSKRLAIGRHGLVRLPSTAGRPIIKAVQPCGGLNS
jgi:hypothetical protein